MQHAMKEPTRLSQEFLTVAGFQLRKIARHFRRQLDETEMLTYMEGLRNLQPDKIERACTRAIETMTRMPFIADLLALANERSEEALYQGRHQEFKEFGLSPLMMEIRDLGREIAVTRFGKAYEELNDKELFECASQAAQIRYARLRRKQPTQHAAARVDLLSSTQKGFDVKARAGNDF